LPREDPSVRKKRGRKEEEERRIGLRKFPTPIWNKGIGSLSPLKV